MAESIKVAVRVRPLNLRERDKRCTIVVSMNDQTTTVQFGRSPKHFTYDFSYWSVDPESSTFSTQEDIFRDIGKVVLSNALEGFNGTLFAYGQTGTGKSYCMMGPNKDPGIIPRTVEQLFRWKAKKEDSEKELQIWISYLEIYKEQVQDLLCAEKDPKASEQLKIMDHPKLGVYVRGLQEVPCASQEEVMKTLLFGIKKRVVAATNMNARSSRSHAVFTIRVHTLEGPRPKLGQKDERKTLHAKLNLIDLAGSERTSKALTDGETLREGCSINVSLSALGTVIKQLSEVAAKPAGKDEKAAPPPAPPFRMSKLTFMLKDSLAGNSKTYMMATISPANDNVDETLSTLRFAASVKNIKTVAVQNKDQKDQLIEKMEEEIRVLKAQIRTGGLNIDEASELVIERTRLRDEMQKDFQGELQNAREMQVAREQALKENGLSQYHITQAFGISKGMPYLLNMADDPMLAGCLIYLLKDGEDTRIGSHRNNTITLKGVGIPDFLCCIVNRGNVQVSLELTSDAGRVVVNGRLLQVGQARELHNGDHIFLGRAYALKLIMPEEQKDASAFDERDLSLEGLEDEYAALDDSPSWRSLAMYLDQVLRQMPANSASQLFKEMKKACKFCDEANELTSECRSNEPIHFEVDLTSSVPACVVIRVLYCVQGRDCEDEDAWETKYLWSVSQLAERVDRMHDHCEEIKRLGYMEIDKLKDPWHEIEYAELSQRLHSLELEREEARFTVIQEKLRKMRTLLAIRPSDQRTNQAILQIFLRFWKMYVEETRRETPTPVGRGKAKPKQKVVVTSAVSSASTSPRFSPRESPVESTRGQGPASSTPITRTASQRTSTTSNISDATLTSCVLDSSPTNGASSLPQLALENPDKGGRPSNKRRLTLKRNLDDTLTPESTKSSRHVRIDDTSSPVSDLPTPHSTPNPFHLDREEKEEQKEAPESTPEVASAAPSIQATDADMLPTYDSAMLRMQLMESEEENAVLRRQLDIAWQLCAVLRDFAVQEQNRQEPIQPEKASCMQDRDVAVGHAAAATPSVEYQPPAVVTVLASSNEPSTTPGTAQAAVMGSVPSTTPGTALAAMGSVMGVTSSPPFQHVSQDVRVRPPPPTRHVAAASTPVSPSISRRPAFLGASPGNDTAAHTARGRSAETSPPRRLASPSPPGAPSTVPRVLCGRHPSPSPPGAPSAAARAPYGSTPSPPPLGAQSSVPAVAYPRANTALPSSTAATGIMAASRAKSKQLMRYVAAPLPGAAQLSEQRSIPGHKAAATVELGGDASAANFGSVRVEPRSLSAGPQVFRTASAPSGPSTRSSAQRQLSADARPAQSCTSQSATRYTSAVRAPSAPAVIASTPRAAQPKAPVQAPGPGRLTVLEEQVRLLVSEKVNANTSGEESVADSTGHEARVHAIKRAVSESLPPA